MRILIFSTAYLPFQGGAEVAIKEITGRISGVEFELICARLKRNLPRKERIGNINIYRIGLGSRFDKVLLPFLGFLKARKIYKLSAISQKPLVLWGMMASWGSLAVLFFKFFYSNIPFLLTLQEGDAENYIEKGRLGLISWSWRRLLRKADYVQVISRYLGEMARKYGYQGEIEIVPNGVDLKQFSIFAISRSEISRSVAFQFSNKNQILNLKEKLGINDGEKIIITVSRLVEKNGISDLIDSAAILNTLYKIHNTKYLILGSGPLEKDLKFKVKSLNLEKQVLFLGDIPNSEVPQYLAISDVFCRPSLSEGLGNSFLEAMAAGVPVIATRVGGIPDFIANNETGLFCEVKNPGDIAGKINLLLTDSGLQQKLIANGRKLAEERYNWDKIAAKMQNIFTDIFTDVGRP